VGPTNKWGSEGKPFEERDRTHIITAKVWFELSSQNLEGRALPNTVGPYKTEDLARSGGRETVELEGISGVSVGDSGF
jgi:hypothetical protein